MSQLAWVDLLHKGTQLLFREPAQEIHGVPVRLALPLGLGVCLGVLLVAALFIQPPWVAAVVCLLAGLVAQSLGAGVYRAARYLKRTILP